MCNWIEDNFLSLLSAFFAFINLVAFIVSVAVLRKTMKAVDRQAERTSKPVIVLRRRDWRLSDAELLEPQLNVDVLIPIQLKNVGNGTALVVHWRFKTDLGEELIHGMIPNIQVGHILKTGLSETHLGLKQGVSRIFECDYLSVSGDKYRTIERVENLKIVAFEPMRIA
jgi:hypothetical protein